ncbi:MAG: transposase [Lentisphaerales bacterium]|nr:transposase [Lentisphaerales bacterium]
MSKKLLSCSVTDTIDSLSYLVLDDSLIAKSGRKIEGVSKVHDHTSSRWNQGYKFLGLSVIR